MSVTSLEKRIIELGEKYDIEDLQGFLKETSTEELTALIKKNLGRNNCIALWNNILLGFNASADFDAKEKRFACVRSLLDGLLHVELSYKQTYDLVTRLCQDLASFSVEQLIEIVEHCVDGLRAGDPKCVSWKDLLPETLAALSVRPQVNVNGIIMMGSKYRDTTIHNLCMLRWPNAILTPIADMFKNLALNAQETIVVLNKFSAALQGLRPPDLPALAFQLFSLCSTANQVMITVLAFDKFFHHFHYKKLFADMESMTTDFDSIDEFSDKELREAEETILHHLNYCTQFKISEVQVCTMLKNFVATPDVILTPFVLSAMLCMSSGNRDPDSRLTTSYVLFFLRNVIKSNEEERRLAEDSLWCRDSFQRKQIDLDQVFSVLIDQNKDGKDVITPGLVNLVFILLKAKNNPALNTLAMNFLTKFIRKRFMFGQGIVKKLAEWMIVEQDQNQYGECLTLLSVSDTFTVSECVKTINYVMDSFVWIHGDQATNMMCFILPVLKISPRIRDAFIEVLRKAITSSDVRTRRMAVYGFCMILKQLNASNSQRSQLSGGVSAICTQHSISGYSLMSQISSGSNRSTPQRNFDMLTLEIIGLLRSCFQQSLDIKSTLYENLQRAVELNPKLVPHVLQFIDWHFRSYFQAPTSDRDATVDGDDDDDESQRFAIKFDRIVRCKDEMGLDIEVNDNLGKLTLFVVHCLMIFETNGSSDYDTREIKRLLNLSLEKIICRDVNLEVGTGSTHLKMEIMAQQLNFIEGLMAYRLLTSRQDNDHVRQLLPLFKEHRRLLEALKTLSNSAKKSIKKSGKHSNESSSCGPNVTVNGVAVKKVDGPVENVWDLTVVEKFMRLLHEDVVPFAAPSNTSSLRSNVDLVRYVLLVAIVKVEGIRLEPNYKQLSHSRRTLKYLTDITKVVYERCIKRLPEVWRDFDVRSAALAAECFHQCLRTANETYKKKFSDVFVKGFDLHAVSDCREAPVIVHDVIDEFMREDSSDGLGATSTSPRAKDDSLSKDTNGRRIPLALFHCLEVLYENISYGNRMTTESYTWLLRFCQSYELANKDLGIVFKLLFTQRQKTHSGAFFNAIARNMGRVFELQTEDEDKSAEESEEETEKHRKAVNRTLKGPSAVPKTIGDFKSITVGSAESCLNHLFATLSKQIQEVEYFIVKANNMCYKIRIIPEEDRDMCLTMLRALERSVCSQLGHISNALLELTNVCIPLGPCMNALLKLLMQHYICLKNLAKHFLTCCGSMEMKLHGLKFDLLLHVVGKPLPMNIYTLISYIEANIFDKDRKRPGNPQLEKAKVLRETKFIPKIVLCVENFNKHVILLAKKTNDRLANFLHIGIVRDFRIRTPELKAAIDRTLSHSSQIVVDDSVDGTTGDGGDGTVEDQANKDDSMLERLEAKLAELDGPSDESKKADENDEAPTSDDVMADLSSQYAKEVEQTKKAAKGAKAGKAPAAGKKAQTVDKVPKNSKTKEKTSKTVTEAKPKPKPKIKLRSLEDITLEGEPEATPTPESIEEQLRNESTNQSHSQLLKNLEKVNKIARKRQLRESENRDPDEPRGGNDVLALQQPQPQAKRLRARPKMKK